MTATPAQVKKLLEVFDPDEYNELDNFTFLYPDEVRDILEAQEVLRRTGADPLFYEDGELIAAMVAWKRKG